MVGDKDTGTESPQMLFALQTDMDAKEFGEEKGSESADTVVGPAPQPQGVEEGG